MTLQPGAEPLKLGPGLGVRVWPMLQRESAAIALPLPFDSALQLSQVSPDSITAFLAVELTASTAGQRLAARFVLKLPLSGAPCDRQKRILRSLLNSRGQVLRFLAMLLAENDEAGPSALGRLAFGDSTGQGRRDSFASFPVFESLVRTVSRSPERLDAVARVVRDLLATPDGGSLLPDGFLDVWEPLWEARQNLARIAADTKRSAGHSTNGQTEASR